MKMCGIAPTVVALGLLVVAMAASGCIVDSDDEPYTDDVINEIADEQAHEADHPAFAPSAEEQTSETSQADQAIVVPYHRQGDTHQGIGTHFDPDPDPWMSPGNPGHDDGESSGRIDPHDSP